MENSKFCLGNLFATIVAFCMSIYLTICSSHWFILFDLLYFCWIIVATTLTIRWCNTIEPKDCIKISKRFKFSGIFFLIAGFVNALISFNPSYSTITTVIGAFCFCCFVLSMFFASIIKHRKNQKDDGNWA